MNLVYKCQYCNTVNEFMFTGDDVEGVFSRINDDPQLSGLGAIRPWIRHECGDGANGIANLIAVTIL